MGRKVAASLDLFRETTSSADELELEPSIPLVASPSRRVCQSTTLRLPQSQSSPFSNDQSGRIVRLSPHGENSLDGTVNVFALETAVTQTPLPGTLQMSKDVKTVPLCS
jgi:hypothetical protein